MNVLTFSGMGRSRLIKDHAFRADRITHEWIEVFLSIYNIDGAPKGLLELEADGASSKAERAGGLDHQVDVRIFSCLPACVAAEERHLVQTVGPCRFERCRAYVIKSNHGRLLSLL